MSMDIRRGVIYRPDGSRVRCYAPGDGHCPTRWSMTAPHVLTI